MPRKNRNRQVATTNQSSPQSQKPQSSQKVALQVRNTTEAGIAPRLETLHGVEHIVVPAVMMVEGVKVFRPGSLMRTSNDKSSQRIPVIGHYNLVTRAYQEIPVAPAQPFEVVFSSAVKGIQKEARDNLEAFKGTLQAMKAQGSNVVEKAWALADQQGALEREIIAEDLKTNGFVR